MQRGIWGFASELDRLNLHFGHMTHVSEARFYAGSPLRMVLGDGANARYVSVTSP
jgi:hypothetical protein